MTISRSNGRWYASAAYWKPPVAPPCRETQSAGGVDVGINPLAMDSDGTTYDNPRGYYHAQRRLKRWQRAQARRTVGSRGWWEAQRSIQCSPPGHGTAEQRAPSRQPGPGRQVHTLGTNPERRRHEQASSQKPCPTPQCLTCRDPPTVVWDHRRMYPSTRPSPATVNAVKRRPAGRCHHDRNGSPQS